jgi:hypothetical protein
VAASSTARRWWSSADRIAPTSTDANARNTAHHDRGARLPFARPGNDDVRYEHIQITSGLETTQFHLVLAEGRDRHRQVLHGLFASPSRDNDFFERLPSTCLLRLSRCGK